MQYADARSLPCLLSTRRPTPIYRKVVKFTVINRHIDGHARPGHAAKAAPRRRIHPASLPNDCMIHDGDRYHNLRFAGHSAVILRRDRAHFAVPLHTAPAAADTSRFRVGNVPGGKNFPIWESVGRAGMIAGSTGVLAARAMCRSQCGEHSSWGRVYLRANTHDLRIWFPFSPASRRRARRNRSCRVSENVCAGVIACSCLQPRAA